MWDAASLERLSILDKSDHGAGIHSLDFSSDGRRLVQENQNVMSKRRVDLEVSVGRDVYQTLCLWDWAAGSLLASARGHTDRVFAARFCPADDALLASAGVQHVKFWSHLG